MCPSQNYLKDFTEAVLTFIPIKTRIKIFDNVANILITVNVFICILILTVN